MDYNTDDIDDSADIDSKNPTHPSYLYGIFNQQAGNIESEDLPSTKTEPEEEQTENTSNSDFVVVNADCSEFRESGENLVKVDSEEPPLKLRTNKTKADPSSCGFIEVNKATEMLNLKSPSQCDVQEPPLKLRRTKTKAAPSSCGFIEVNKATKMPNLKSPSQRDVQEPPLKLRRTKTKASPRRTKTKAAPRRTKTKAAPSSLGFIEVNKAPKMPNLRSSSQLDVHCVLCGKSFITIASLVIHAHNHIDRSRCGVCGRPFESVAILKSHLHFHVARAPFLSCYICGMCFKKDEGKLLEEHIMNDHKQNLNRCLGCQKCFKTTHDLRIHMRSHTKTMAQD